MMLELIAQSVPSTGAVIAAGLVVLLLLTTYLDPELVEIYLGDSQLVATLALAAVVLIFVAAAPTDAAHQQLVDAVSGLTR
jgi:uncharacterized membrane protein YraQ (UPF0718 family)